MSYNRAWGLVQALNEGFGEPLVTSSRGGAAQGGATLTEAGKFVLAGYRNMQRNTRAAIEADLGAIRQRFDMSCKR